MVAEIKSNPGISEIALRGWCKQDQEIKSCENSEVSRIATYLLLPEKLSGVLAEVVKQQVSGET